MQDHQSQNKNSQAPMSMKKAEEPTGTETDCRTQPSASANTAGEYSTPKKRPSKALIILAFAAVYVIWGSTYLGIKYAIGTLPPLLMAGTRFITAGAILFAWASFRGEKSEASRRFSLKNWRRAFIIGALLFLCGNGGVTWAEVYLPSGLTALLIATEPLWVVTLNWTLGAARPNAKLFLGLFAGLLGVALLFGGGLDGGATAMTLVAAGVVIASAVAWAGGSIYSIRRPIQRSAAMAAAMQMLAGGTLLLLVGLIIGEYQRLNLRAATWVSIGALVYLILFGSIAFTAYSWLLRNVSPARAATYAYVNPVVAVLLGWAIASEPVTSRMLVAAAIIIASVALITTYGKEPAQNSLVPSNEKESVLDPDHCPNHPCR